MNLCTPKEFGFVYMIFDSSGILYIGSTTNPIQRLNSHLSPKGGGALNDEQRRSVSHVRLAFAGTEEDAVYLEASLIMAYKPKCNKDNSYYNARICAKYHEENFRWVTIKKTEFEIDKTVCFRCFKENGDSRHELEDIQQKLSLREYENQMLQNDIEQYRKLYENERKHAKDLFESYIWANKYALDSQKRLLDSQKRIRDMPMFLQRWFGFA